MAAPSLERWEMIEPLLDQALDLAPEGRPAFLASTCSTDPALRLDVERLLEGTDLAGALLGDSAAALASPMLARLVKRQAFAPGERLGAYQIERELGRGGMATVYLARDLRHDRLVALKVLRRELSETLGAERFARETAIAARLNHPHILALFDSGSLDTGVGERVLYYAMPYVEGRSLRDRLRAEPQLPIDEAVEIARQVAEALDHAHQHGIVHRDIKPENVLLAGAHAFVSDFGIARALGLAGGERLTESGLALGTPAYMSPEQATASPVDGRADLYGLGCMVYEMLAGNPPFTGPTAQAVLARHAVDPVPPLRTVRRSVPANVELAVNRALEKVPADRFATAGEFVTALTAAAPLRAARRPLRRELVGGVAAAAVLAVGIGYVVRRPAVATRSDPKLVAILPFRTSGASPELAWLQEGLVDLLAIKLSGEGGLRAAEPHTALNVWRQVTKSGREVVPGTAPEVARQIGAGRVIDGSVVGTSAHLTLGASLIAEPGGRDVARVSVDGSADSLSVLVDRLAARLLSLGGGVNASQLSSITSSSLPAIRAYLTGRAAFRKGHLEEAFRQFRQATLLDSTFALAALELVHTSIWVAIGSEDAERGKRLALAGRDRLGPSDRALLDAWAGPHPTSPDMFQRWQAAATAYPDLAETWFWLGDNYYHWGMLAGLDDPLRLAAEAFERSWAIDSASGTDSLSHVRSPNWAEPLVHMVEIAQMKGDTASVRRLVAEGLAADTAGRQSWYLRWHRAAALGDSARRTFWADSQRIDPTAFAQIARFIVWTGVIPQDYPLASSLSIAHTDPSSPQFATQHRYWVAMNGGRPHDAPAVDSIRDALYWGGDTTAARIAAQELEPRARLVSLRGEEGKERLENFITLADWRAARGDYDYAQMASRRLRTARVTGLGPNDSLELAYYATLSASLFAAIRATALRLPDARAKLEQADAEARTYVVVKHSGPVANLIIARLAEAQGDLPLALRAVRRRMVGFELGEWYLSTFLHEEGRLAALVGDTTGAIGAYRHYLALRPNPEPEVRPEVDAVRSELARLTQGRR